MRNYAVTCNLPQIINQFQEFLTQAWDVGRTSPVEPFQLWREKPNNWTNSTLCDMMQSENVMRQPKKEALKSLQSRMVDGVQAPLMLCKPIESMAKPLTVQRMEREVVGQIKCTQFYVSEI